jgi:hypothetical protein
VSSAFIRPLCSRDLLRRWAAAGCAALVLALTIFAASPSAHASLHDEHVDSPGEHTCAVTLFASSASLDVAPNAITPPTLVAQGIPPVTAAEIFLAAPRYLRQPERGPPASWVS